MLKRKMSTLAGVLAILAFTGCNESNITEPQITVQPKTSGYYTSVLRGSNGPAFQLITITNPITSSGPLTINSISISNSSAASIAARSSATGQTDPFYGSLPECGSSSGTGIVTTLAAGETCALLVQGKTYNISTTNPQTGQISIQTTIAGSGSNTATFNLSDTTHFYIAPAVNSSIGGLTPTASTKSVLADCTNASAGAAMTCVNALDTGYLTGSTSDLQVLPNGNVILGGGITVAGNSTTAVPVNDSAIFVCQPGSDNCYDALGDNQVFSGNGIGSYNGYVGEIELNPDNNNQSFFVAGNFVEAGSNLTATTGPFVAECTLGGNCVNVTPGTIATNGSNQTIYSLAFDPDASTYGRLYFSGGFKTFGNVDYSSGDATSPIVICDLNSSGTCSSTAYAAYFPNLSAYNNATIFGLKAETIDGTRYLEINSNSTSLAGTTTGNMKSALCTSSSSCTVIQTDSTSTLTERGVYDSNTGLYYIPGTFLSLGSMTILTTSGATTLAACPLADFANCYDVLGGGTSNTFTGYPTTPAIGAPGAQLTVTAQ